MRILPVSAALSFLRLHLCFWTFCRSGHKNFSTPSIALLDFLYLLTSQPCQLHHGSLILRKGIKVARRPQRLVRIGRPKLFRGARHVRPQPASPVAHSAPAMTPVPLPRRFDQHAAGAKFPIQLVRLRYSGIKGTDRIRSSLAAPIAFLPNR